MRKRSPPGNSPPRPEPIASPRKFWTLLPRVTPNAPSAARPKKTRRPTLTLCGGTPRGDLTDIAVAHFSNAVYQMRRVRSGPRAGHHLKSDVSRRRRHVRTGAGHERGVRF